MSTYFFTCSYYPWISAVLVLLCHFPRNLFKFPRLENCRSAETNLTRAERISLDAIKETTPDSEPLRSRTSMLDQQASWEIGQKSAYAGTQRQPRVIEEQHQDKMFDTTGSASTLVLSTSSFEKYPKVTGLKTVHPDINTVEFIYENKAVFKNKKETSKVTESSWIDSNDINEAGIQKEIVRKATDVLPDENIQTEYKQQKKDPNQTAEMR